MSDVGPTDAGRLDDLRWRLAHREGNLAAIDDPGLRGVVKQANDDIDALLRYIDVLLTDSRTLGDVTATLRAARDGPIGPLPVPGDSADPVGTLAGDYLGAIIAEFARIKAERDAARRERDRVAAEAGRLKAEDEALAGECRAVACELRSWGFRSDLRGRLAHHAEGFAARLDAALSARDEHING